MTDARLSRDVQEVAKRAVRRLDVLEWVILGAAAVLALVAGALIAVIAQAALGVSFRATWFGASLVLFVVPAALARRTARRADDGEGPAGEDP